MDDAEDWLLDNDVQFMKDALRLYAEKTLHGIEQMEPPTTQSEIVQAVRVLALYVLRYDQYLGGSDYGEQKLDIRVLYGDEEL